MLCCRATDETGDAQPLEPEWNLGGYENNAVQRVPVSCAERGEAASRRLRRSPTRSAERGAHRAVLVCTSSLEYAFSRWRRTVPAEIQSRAAISAFVMPSATRDHRSRW